MVPMEGWVLPQPLRPFINSLQQPFFFFCLVFPYSVAFLSNCLKCGKVLVKCFQVSFPRLPVYLPYFSCLFWRAVSLFHFPAGFLVFCIGYFHWFLVLAFSVFYSVIVWLQFSLKTSMLAFPSIPSFLAQSFHTCFLNMRSKCKLNQI